MWGTGKRLNKCEKEIITFLNTFYSTTEINKVIESKKLLLDYGVKHGIFSDRGNLLSSAFVITTMENTAGLTTNKNELQKHIENVSSFLKYCTVIEVSGNKEIVLRYDSYNYFLLSSQDFIIFNNSLNHWGGYISEEMLVNKISFDKLYKFRDQYNNAITKFKDLSDQVIVELKRLYDAYYSAASEFFIWLRKMGEQQKLILSGYNAEISQEKYSDRSYIRDLKKPKDPPIYIEVNFEHAESFRDKLGDASFMGYCTYGYNIYINTSQYIDQWSIYLKKIENEMEVAFIELKEKMAENCNKDAAILTILNKEIECLLQRCMNNDKIINQDNVNVIKRKPLYDSIITFNNRYLFLVAQKGKKQVMLDFYGRMISEEFDEIESNHPLITKINGAEYAFVKICEKPELAFPLYGLISVSGRTIAKPLYKDIWFNSVCPHILCVKMKVGKYRNTDEDNIQQGYISMSGEILFNPKAGHYVNDFIAFTNNITGEKYYRAIVQFFLNHSTPSYYYIIDETGKQTGYEYEYLDYKNGKFSGEYKRHNININPLSGYPIINT